MLYSIHEFQQAATASVRTAMQAGQMIMRNPLNPLTHTDFGHSTAAACELINYTTRRRNEILPQVHEAVLATA